MNPEYFFDGARKHMPKRSVKPPLPHRSHGTDVTGKIVAIRTGQGHGFIRLPDGREIYFHRADLQEGTAFNDLRVGDAVQFELLEDAVSGARALGLARRQAGDRRRQS